PILASRRSPANSLPTGGQKSHLQATLESAYERSSVWHSVSGLDCPGSATGRRCATGKRCCSTPYGRSRGGDDTPTDAPAWRALATTAQSTPTAHPRSQTLEPESLLSYNTV